MIDNHCTGRFASIRTKVTSTNRQPGYYHNTGRFTETALVIVQLYDGIGYQCFDYLEQLSSSGVTNSSKASIQLFQRTYHPIKSVTSIPKGASYVISRD